MTNTRVRYLDGIRAVAILSVLVVHWGAPMAQSILPGAGIARGGYIGVDIFFVLSGYIITSMLWRGTMRGTVLGQYGRFLRRRVIRLYPALLGLVIVTLLIYAVYPGAPSTVSDLIQPGVVALVQGTSFYLGSRGGGDSPFGITWSLSIEWMFYLLWPVAVLLAERWSVSALRLAIGAGIAGVVFYVIALTQDEHWFYFGPVARVPEILAGGVLALLLASSKRTNKDGSPVLSAAALVSLAGVLVYVFLGPPQWSFAFRVVGLPLAVLATVLLIWAGTGSHSGPVSRALSWGPLPLIGRVSYSLYLWHEVGFNLLVLNPGPIPLAIAAVLSVVVSAAMTALSYRFLEVPFLKSGRVSQTTGGDAVLPRR
jgi:peptidoglycan/LPS O-acetylase OafA/YrhL